MSFYVLNSDEGGYLSQDGAEAGHQARMPQGSATMQAGGFQSMNGGFGYGQAAAAYSDGGFDMYGMLGSQMNLSAGQNRNGAGCDLQRHSMESG